MCRPLSLLFFKTFRPLAVIILFKKPCVRTRFFFLGWYVRLVIGEIVSHISLDYLLIVENPSKMNTLCPPARPKYMDPQNLWHHAQNQLKQQLPAGEYQTFIAPLLATSPKPDELVLSTNNKYILDLIQKRYQSLIIQTLQSLSSSSLAISFLFDPTIQKITPTKNTDSSPLFSTETLTQTQKTNHGLNPRYTFANLVVGNSNNFAYAAAQAIIQSPGSTHNPFFIYGGVGVGKTHLMQAIGHELLKNNPSLKVRYFPSETFANDLYASLKNKNSSQFKDNYRQLDCILVDDIQFIAGKEYTQEEFFNTFNSLYLAGKQIILTSDRKPADIKDLENRLVSRFLGGLTVDIQLPDYEMRVAILRQKAEEKNIRITPEALNLLAEQPPTNIRDLEGQLQHLAISAISQHLPEITPELVQPNQTLKLANHHPRHIISICAKTMQVKTTDLTGKSRKQDLAQARHITAYLLLTVGNLPLQEVGELLGGRDHTSIMHARDKIQASIHTNPQLSQLIHTIQSNL